MRSNFRLSWPVLLSAAFAALVLTAQPAAAQLTLCNQSSETVSMALAYRDGGQLISRGWYVAKPGECPTIVSGSLSNRYYYVRAEGSGGNQWAGDYAFCAKDALFAHAGENCAADGLDRRNFFVIDTGDSSSWTQTLTANASGTDREQLDHEAISALRVVWRPSLLDDGSYVMQLHNDKPTTVDVGLKCFTTSGNSKTLAIRVPGYGLGEVGFVQGWDGNFVAGESCEAYHGRELVWRTTLSR